MKAKLQKRFEEVLAKAAKRYLWGKFDCDKFLAQYTAEKPAFREDYINRFCTMFNIKE